MDLTQAYFLLKSLKDNIPDTHEIDEKWVSDFHKILDTVEKETDSDLTAFRVDASELFHPQTGASRAYARRGRIVPGIVHYSERNVIKGTRFMHKLDAILSYFQFKQGSGESESRIGFKK